MTILQVVCCDKCKAGGEASDFHYKLAAYYLAASCSESEADFIGPIDLIV